MSKHILIALLLLFSFSLSYTHASPQASRGPQYADYLDASVRIQYGNSSGSGTIIYYDRKTSTAFVASCGHLWDKNSTRAQCTIFSWYQNKIRRQQKTYSGRCVFYDSEKDVSLVIFKPDWRPSYFVIAPFDAKVGNNYVSTGCDFASEVAAYVVRVTSKQTNGDIITRPGPRPGRSGGGLLQSGYYVGICVRTSDESGDGYGVYVGLPNLRSVYKSHGYDWLLSLKPYDFAKRLKVRSHTNPNKVYPENWVVIP